MSEKRLSVIKGGSEAEDLWDVERAAQYLGMSVSWVYRQAEQGLIPSRRVGSRVRFLPHELRALVDEGNL